MNTGWRLFLAAVGLLLAAQLAAIPFARRFAAINNGDSIIPNLIGVGYEMWPSALGSFVLLCASGACLVVSLTRLVRGKSKEGNMDAR